MGAAGAGADFQAFQKSELLRGAVVQKLAIIGEAGRASLGRPQDPPPPGVLATDRTFRNILVHAYIGIDWDVVWRDARSRCLVLREQVAGILAAESAGPEDDGR